MTHSRTPIASIQGLRAIAVALVVMAHAKLEWIAGGFVGVDVFFVLSGYLITGLLLTEIDATGRVKLATFFARRLKRLLPALLFSIAVSGLLAKWVLSDYELREQSQSTLFAISWVSNVYFALSQVDYFSSLRLHDLYLHTWSLGVEEQFYLLWPLVLLATCRFAPATGDGQNYRLYCLFAIALLSFALMAYWSFGKPMWSFYLMPARIWQFSLGAAVWVMLRGDSDIVPGAASAPWWQGAGLGLILFSALYLSNDQQYPGLWVLLPSLGAAFFLVGIHQPSMWNRVLSLSGLTWLGDRSYSLYLWHWPILMIGFSLGLDDSKTGLLSLVLVALLLAMLSYRLIELPFWKGQFSRAPARISISCALVAMAAVALAQTITIGQSQSVQSLALSQASMDKPAIYQQECDSFLASADLHACVSGHDQAEKTIVLIGDSVLAQWHDLFPRIFAEPTWRVVLHTKSACPMVDEDIFYQPIGGTYTVCSNWRNALLDELAILQPDVVVVGNSASYPFTDKQWIEGSARIYQKLAAASDKVLVLAATPTLSFNGPACLARALQDGGATACSTPVSKNQAAKLWRIYKAATASYPEIQRLDLSGLVCPQGLCRAKSAQGIIVFRDASHLSNSFVLSLLPQVRQELEELQLLP